MSLTEREKSRPGEMRVAWTHPSERGGRILQIAADSTEDPAVGFKYEKKKMKHGIVIAPVSDSYDIFILFFKIDHFLIPTSMLTIAKYH
jgi:hypothetical protein